MSPAASQVRQEASGLTARLLVRLLRGYRLLLSPSIGNACRFTPTCSIYAIGAVERHGAAAGSALAAARVARCHPWCAGGHDPVPDEAPRLFRKFTTRNTAASSPSAPGAIDASSS